MKYITTVIALLFIFTASLSPYDIILVLFMLALVWCFATEAKLANRKAEEQAQVIYGLVEQGVNGDKTLAETLASHGFHKTSLKVEKSN